MKKLIMTFIMICILSCGCATSKQDYSSYSDYYQNKIQEWQTELADDGWSEPKIDEIMTESREVMDYVPDINKENDNWLTPAGLELTDYRGDCEDIAVCMWNSLKQLGYPYAVRIRIVDTINSHHAIVVVQLPDKTWKEYNTTNCVYYQPIVEFDEEHYWELWANNEDR